MAWLRSSTKSLRAIPRSASPSRLATCAACWRRLPRSECSCLVGRVTDVIFREVEELAPNPHHETENVAGVDVRAGRVRASRFRARAATQAESSRRQGG